MVEETQTQVDVAHQRMVAEDGTVVDRKTTVARADAQPAGSSVAANVVRLVYTVLASLLGLRVLLSLLAANGTNPFADFMYTITGPFVAPFRSLFGVDTTIGESGSRVEIETLVAILVYGLIAWIIIRALRVKKEA